MTPALTIAKIHNPLNRADRDIVCYEWTGEALSEIKNKLVPQELQFAISVNGKVVTDLERIIPMPGDMVVFVPQLCGGNDGSGKLIGRIIATIVVTVAAIYSGGAAAELYGPIWGSMVSSAVMVVGGILINTLLPMPNKVNTQGNNAIDSNAYSWGPTTLQQEGAVVARWYGTNKLTGNIIGGYVERIGDKNYDNILISLGIGPFFNVNLNNIKINNQIYSVFKDTLQPVIRLGKLDQEIIPNFNNTKIEYPLSIKVEHANSFTYTTIGSDFSILEIDITFPQGVWSINKENGNVESNMVEFKLEISKHNENDWNVIASNNTFHLLAPEQAHWSLGYWTLDVNTGLKYWTEVYYGEVIENTNYIEPIHYNGEPGNLYGFANGTEWYAFLGLTYVYLENTETYNFVSNTIGTKSLTFPVYNLEIGSKYDIRITRISLDITDIQRYGGDLYLATVREVLTDDFQYPRQALCGLRALATDQLSGSLGFSCIADCLMVRIYDGENWSVGFTKNPAWICYDVLSLPVFDNNLNVVRYDGINPSRLNTDKFLEWAEWCDELVPNGDGGTEARYEFNGGFDSEMNLWEAAFQICAIAGATLVWNGIKLTVAIDKPSNPVQLFTVGNCGIDSFKETFLPMVDRAAEIEVDFLDEKTDYKRTKLTVTNENITNAVSKVNLQLFGVTKASQAWRIAMRRLKNNELLVRTLEFTADIDAIACTVGDVINFQHDVPQWGFGGRIVSATETIVTLDTEVVIEENVLYTILIRLKDDTLISKGIANLAGTYSELTLTSPFDVVPEKYDVYAFGESGINVKPFKILDISRNGDLQATLNCIEYNESIYNADYDLPTIPTINYSALDNFPSVKNYLAFEKYIAASDGLAQDVIFISWEKPNSSIFKSVDIFIDYGEGVEFVTNNDQISFKFNIGFRQGNCKIYIRTVNTAGQKQSLSDCPVISLQINGLSAYMPDITSVSQFYQGTQAVLRWTPVTDNRPFLYEVRMGSDFKTAMILGTTEDNTWLVSGNGTYWITVKSFYSYSENPAEIIITGATLVKNVIATWDEAATDWSGILSGGVEIDAVNRLWLKNIDGVVETDGEYEIPTSHIVDIGSVQTCQVSCNYVASSDNPNALVDNIEDFDSLADFDGNYAGFSNVKVQIALSQNGTDWDAWIDFVPGPYKAQAFKMKVKFESLNTSVTAVLSEFTWSVDVPDRSELLTNVAINASGTTVNFSKPFQIVPNVQVTILDAQSGDMINFLSGPNESGLTLKIINGGVGVNRNCNIFAQAY